jgi:hypothetical protein
MAESRRFVCTQCAHEIEAWSDGNPFYLDERGRKRHAYHPDHENLDRCVGNDVPHLVFRADKERKSIRARPAPSAGNARQNRWLRRGSWKERLVLFVAAGSSIGIERGSQCRRPGCRPTIVTGMGS